MLKSSAVVAANVLLSFACSAQQGEVPANPGQPVTIPAAATKPAAPAVEPKAQASDDAIKSVDDLLKALETADKDLKTLTSAMLWTKEFELGGDRHIRKATLSFVDERGSQAPGTAPGVRKFAVDISERIISNPDNPKGDRLDRDREEYIFDGAALVEKHHLQKRLVRHQLKQAGAATDPMKIGEGPIPLPVGQKREDILVRFDATLLPPEQDLPKDDPKRLARLQMLVKDCYQLKLIPKAEFLRECSFKEARLWYRREQAQGQTPRLLPRMALAYDKKGDTDLVELINVRINEPVDAAFDTKLPEGWQEEARAAGN